MTEIQMIVSEALTQKVLSSEGEKQILCILRQETLTPEELVSLEELLLSLVSKKVIRQVDEQLQFQFSKVRDLGLRVQAASISRNIEVVWGSWSRAI